VSAQAPLVTFVGTTPNIGTTLAAFAAACRIAEGSEASVGFLCLNLKSSKIHRYLGVDKPEVTLDSLRPELRSGSLLPEKLLRSMHPANIGGRLHVMFGNIMRDQAEFFTAEEMDHLLDVARQSFDIIIADVGAYWDNAATLCALRRSSSRMIVTTGALSHFQEDAQRWIKQLSPMFGIPSDQYEAVIIQPPWRIGGFQVKDICNELGVPLIGELKLTEPMLSQLDTGSLDEWLTLDEQGKEAMTEPALQLQSRYGLQRRMGISAQPWYKKLLTHRSGVST
jgi:Flp pilus assembly CpaE family ATPase